MFSEQCTNWRGHLPNECNRCTEFSSVQESRTVVLPPSLALCVQFYVRMVVFTHI